MVVAAGVAVALPDPGTEPPPGAIETVVAPVVLQLSVELPPALMLPGLAVKLLITGFEGAEATVMVTCLVTLPAELIAVIVYVVVEEGHTIT